MRATHVLILYNEPVLPAAHPDAESEHEVLWTVEVVSKTLLQAGFRVSRLGANDSLALLTGVQSLRPDVVFNLFEGTADRGITEAYVAGLLEWLDIPYTGCPFQALCLARSKHITKHLLHGAGLPTASFFVVEDMNVPACTLEWPVIVKPATQDASVGLDQGSVVTTQEKLTERVHYLLKTYGPPVLVEEFISGRELNVGLIEAPDLRALPVSEILFVHSKPGYWPIVTYDAKWKPGSHDYEATPPRYPAEVTPKLSERLTTLAKHAFRLLGCRDYARVDFRVRQSGKPYILEVNPNPDFSPSAGLAGGLASAGLTHAQFAVDLVKATLLRGQKVEVVQFQPEASIAIRAPRVEEVDVIRQLLSGAGIMTAVELADLGQDVVSDSDGANSARESVRVLEAGDQLAGVAWTAKASRTEGTHILRAIVIKAGSTSRGLGRQLLAAVEAEVRSLGGCMLVAELSSSPRFAPVRRFLQNNGFSMLGDVPDFFRAGESRLTFAKYLNTTTF